ncbi:unnamed protein product [Closterium sp. Naga37s-1]|nr:unnamed protein product [Closterium sp. Naga37s-1]
MARMLGAARLLSVRVVYGLLLALVLFAALHVDALRQASPTGRPTRDQMLKEIKVATSVVKQKPGYKRVATLIQVGLPKAPKKYDITRLYNGTLLAGNDNAVKVLLKKIDVAKPADLDKVFRMLLQMTLQGRFNDTLLKKKPMVNFPTNGVSPLKKMTPKNAPQITFGVPGSPATTWATMLTPNLYVGKWFTVHGVNYFII